MKRCFDETGPSEAGGDNFNSCTDVVDNAAFESHHSSCVRLTTLLQANVGSRERRSAFVA